MVDKVALEQVFSKYFGFPCQFSFHRMFHIHHHPSSGAGAVGQLVADVPSGLSLTPPQVTKKKVIISIDTHNTQFMQLFISNNYIHSARITDNYLTVPEILNFSHQALHYAVICN
jgi:hypothetical protein